MWKGRNRERSQPDFFPLTTSADSCAGDVHGAFWRTFPPQMRQSGMQIDSSAVQLLAQCLLKHFPVLSKATFQLFLFQKKNSVSDRQLRKSLILIKPNPCYELVRWGFIYIYIYIKMYICIYDCLHPRMIGPGKSKVEQETCFPALESMLRSQKHPLVWAGANPRFQTSFNEVKKEKYFWNSSGMFWLFLNRSTTKNQALPNPQSAHQQTSLCASLLGKPSPWKFYCS